MAMITFKCSQAKMWLDVYTRIISIDKIGCLTTMNSKSTALYRTE